MYKLWKANTIVTVLIAVVAALAYAAGGDAGSPIVAGMLAAVFAFVIAMQSGSFLSAPTIAVSMAATFAVYIVFRQADPLYGLLPTAYITVPIAIAGLGAMVSAVANAKYEGAHETLVELAIATLPFGVGTVFGGIILGLRHLVGVETGNQHQTPHHVAG